MDAFDRELAELSDAFSKDEELRAARRRFEQSALWHEHKRFHEEQHTQAHIVVWEEQALPVLQREFAAEEPVERKHIKVGGCECQPKLPFMQLDERNEVIAGIPVPVEEAKGYGAAPNGYAQGTLSNGSYSATPGAQKELYR